MIRVIKTIFSKIISFCSVRKPANKNNTLLNLKKASIEEIEKSRCKQYDYIA